MYEIGKEYNFNGQPRLVTGIDGEGYPITTLIKTNSNLGKKSVVNVFSPTLQIQYEELALQLEEKENKLIELEKLFENVKSQDKTQIAADIFCMFDPLKLPSVDDLKKIAEYLGYTIKEEFAKADIIKLIRKE